MSALERTEAALAEAHRRADQNIFLDFDPAGACEAAQAADRREKPLGPLDGKLIGIKANIAVKGLPWSAAIEGWRHRIARNDAAVVTRLRALGAIILGTLNMHEGALGAVTDPPGYGRCANPLDPERTPGGSSGGSAAAIAAGLVDAALGSDTMGSVRVPAAYCGLAGIKPTDGLIRRSGLAYLSPSLDTIGPLAPIVRDLWPLLDALVGPDPSDPGSQPLPPQWPPELAWKTDLTGIRIGRPSQIDDVECEAEIIIGLDKSIATLETLGAEIVPLEIAGWDPGRARRAGLVLTEAEGAVQMAALLDGPVDAISPGFRNLLAYGRDVSSARMVDALARMSAAGAACTRAMDGIDALILPTCPQRAFIHGTPAPTNQADFTALANFARCPAISLPVPLPNETLPAAVQLLGHPGADPALLTIADLLERTLCKTG